MKKTVIVMGTGAQGGTIAMRLNEEPNIGKIICIMSWTFATEEEIAFYKWLARIFHAHDGFIDKALRNAAVVYYCKFLIRLSTAANSRFRAIKYIVFFLGYCS